MGVQAFLEAMAAAGYGDGSQLGVPAGCAHPAYVHGFLNGRDDLECALALRQWPRRTAAEARAAWAYIQAVEVGP